MSKKATHGFAARKDGKRNPIYVCWESIIQRCANPKNPFYKNYGERGIAVCRRWRDFRCFFVDIGIQWCPGLWIERINNDGDYEPGNCRWATAREQNNNTRFNRVVEIDGQKKSVSEWARLYGLSPASAHKRIHKGWDAVRAVSEPIQEKFRGTYALDV